MTQAITPKISLYEQDLNLWLETVIAQLKAGNLQNLDVENLIEELEGLAGRDRRELKTRLTTLIEHLLKRCYVNSEYDYAGWQTTITRTRIEIENILEQSPSLKHYINSPELFETAFKNALRLVQSESGYQSVQFPNTWQFDCNVEALLTINFWEIITGDRSQGEYSMIQAITPKISLYEQDLNLWLETAIAQLKAGDLQNLDVENLIEELEGLAGRDRRELKNRIRTLLEHLLKRLYVAMPQEFNGWERTIREQRIQIEIILEQSPSLKTIWDESFQSAWRYAIKAVSEDYPQSQFPDLWQFDRNIEAILTVKFWEITSGDRSQGEY